MSEASTLNPDLAIRIKNLTGLANRTEITDAKSGAKIRGITRIEIDPLRLNGTVKARIDVELLDQIDIECELSAVRVIDMRAMLRQIGTPEQEEADADDRAPILECAVARVMDLVEESEPSRPLEGPRWGHAGSLKEKLRREIAGAIANAVLHDRAKRTGASRV